MEELVSEFTCPVCLNTLQAPVRLCATGHGTCGKCQKKLEKCPQCSEEFIPTNFKNVLLNKVVDLLPHECRFDGCQEFVSTEHDHEKWCGYQPATCKLSKCKWTGCAKDIHDHIKKSHLIDTHILSENNLNCSYPKVNLSHDSWTPVFVHGHFFWMHRSKNADGTTVDVNFDYVPNEKMKFSLKLTLSFGNPKKSVSTAFYITPENVFNNEETSMSFVYSRLQSLINSKGELPCSLVIVKDK